LFCEHHEDILLKRKDGRYHCLQIKTKEGVANPWKSDDVTVVAALAKFAKLEASHGAEISHFTFGTNHPFFQATKNGKNLPFLLESIRGVASMTEAPTIVQRYVKKIASTGDVSIDAAWRTLKKTLARDDLPKLTDIGARVREEIIRNHQPAQDCVPAQISRAGNDLRNAMHSAASLNHLEDIALYLAIGAPPEEALQQRIDGKRFTRSRIETILNGSLTLNALLEPEPNGTELTKEAAHDRLRRKLEAGGLSVVTINLAIDLRAAALHSLFEWRAKFGEKEALRRYEHLKTLVLKDCASAHEETKNAEAGFGRQMLDRLRHHLQQRVGTPDTRDLSQDHLEGYAYELTGACRVWWSEPFTI